MGLLYLDTAQLLLLSDASFSNAKGARSQICYIIFIVDDGGRCNILHYGSNEFQLIERSVIEEYFQAIVHVFHHAYFVRDLVTELLGRTIHMEYMIYSRTVFNVVSKDRQITGKRLQIGILALMQNYGIVDFSRIS